MPDDLLSSILPALRDLSRWFENTQTPYLVIGGVAVSLIARPRLTKDVDSVVLIDQAAWADFVESGAGWGFVPRIADAVEFARRSRVLLMAHQPSRTNLDISLAGLPFEAEAIDRGVPFQAPGFAIRLPRVEDLIIMKAVASRAIDLADIDTILNIHPRVDRRRILRWVRDFAATLETPELIEPLERLLAAKRVPRRRSEQRPMDS